MTGHVRMERFQKILENPAYSNRYSSWKSGRSSGGTETKKLTVNFAKLGESLDYEASTGKKKNDNPLGGTQIRGIRQEEGPRKNKSCLQRKKGESK